MIFVILTLLSFSTHASEVENNLEPETSVFYQNIYHNISEQTDQEREIYTTSSKKLIIERINTDFNFGILIEKANFLQKLYSFKEMKFLNIDSNLRIFELFCKSKIFENSESYFLYKIGFNINNINHRSNEYGKHAISGELEYFKNIYCNNQSCHFFKTVASTRFGNSIYQVKNFTSLGISVSKYVNIVPQILLEQDFFRNKIFVKKFLTIELKSKKFLTHYISVFKDIGYASKNFGVMYGVSLSL